MFQLKELHVLSIILNSVYSHYNKIWILNVISESPFLSRWQILPHIFQKYIFLLTSEKKN